MGIVRAGGSHEGGRDDTVLERPIGGVSDRGALPPDVGDAVAGVAYPVTRKARVTYTGSGYSDGYAKGTQADLGTSRLSGTGPRPSAAAGSAAQDAGAVRWPGHRL